MDEAPEEVFMGGVAKKGKVQKFEDALEREEMDAFRRVSMTTKEKKALRSSMSLKWWVGSCWTCKQVVLKKTSISKVIFTQEYGQSVT